VKLHAPYPGLRPFRRDENRIFFGRAEHVDAMLETLRRAHLLAVVGPSGGGKSSLVRAGMLHAIEAGFMPVERPRWCVVEMRPGGAPLRRLAAALRPAIHLAGATPDQQTGMLESILLRGPLGLIERVRAPSWPTDTNLVLLVDQFEELFRFTDGEGSAEAETFVRLLLAATAEKGLPLFIVLTMRSDYLERCDQFLGLPEALHGSVYLTPRLNRAQLRQAIEGPAQLFGGSVEPALTAELLEEIDPDQDQLPILQHALLRTWTRARSASGQGAGAGRGARLTVKAYEGIGRMKDALSWHASEAYRELDTRQQAIADALFRTLSEGGPKSDARRPSQLRVVASHAGATIAETYAVARVFERPEYGFITITRHAEGAGEGTVVDGEAILDLSHEALIRLWPSLRERPGRAGQSRAWTERNLSDWMDRKALELCVRRATEWHASLSPEEIFALYCERAPQEAQRRNAAADWRQAEVYFAADVLDGRFTLSENLGPESYWRLEGVWLREVKELKAYFHWKPQGGWGVGLTRGHYWTACNELVDRLRDGRIKAAPSAFAPIQRYLRDRPAGAASRRDNSPSVEAKVRRLVELGVPEGEARRRVDDHLAAFYGEIASAVSEAPTEAATRRVLEALGLLGGWALADAIVDCLEMAIAIQFLDAGLVGRILDEVAPMRLSA
jgi:hypothetical protein